MYVYYVDLWDGKPDHTGAQFITKYWISKMRNNIIDQHIGLACMNCKSNNKVIGVLQIFKYSSSVTGKFRYVLA